MFSSAVVIFFTCSKFNHKTKKETLAKWLRKQQQKPVMIHNLCVNENVKPGLYSSGLKAFSLATSFEVGLLLRSATGDINNLQESFVI